jgi:hypothetical protein
VKIVSELKEAVGKGWRVPIHEATIAADVLRSLSPATGVASHLTALYFCCPPNRMLHSALLRVDGVVRIVEQLNESERVCVGSDSY